MEILTLLSAQQPVTEQLESLHADLDRLKHDLADAWVSPDRSAHVPGIEKRIREKWDQIDGLAVLLSEPAMAHAREPEWASLSH